jgi:hypothetical protein
MDESKDFKIYKNLEEAKLETLLQIVAVLIDRLGGEVFISRGEFEMMEDVPVMGHSISDDYAVFRLGDIDIEIEILEDHTPLDPT